MSFFSRIKNKAGQMKKKINSAGKKLEGGLLQKKRYAAYVESCPVMKNVVLLESQHGRAIGGNILALLRELCEKEEYRGFTVYLTATKGNYETFRQMIKENGWSRATVLCRGSFRYHKILATAGYLVNDNTFMYYFIKRDEQIYLNTWHGTPLKTLGKESKSEYYSIGNAQKTFLDADYVLYPNRFTMEHMIRDYMVDNIGQFTPLLGGYPRNTAFFDEEGRERLRKKYDLEGKTAYAYMPTWRGTVGRVSRQEDARIFSYFRELDALFSDDQILYVKMHTISGSRISFDKFSHIRPFPEADTYAFLNAMDGLITDYSSIMFDFAISGRKVILFPYDLEEYEETRGFYFPYEELPFPKVFHEYDLYLEMGKGKEYDDSEFLKKFCAYDSADAAEKLCHHVFLGESRVQEEILPDNGKENVLLYCGDLALNGITVSINNLLANVDVTEKNYTILIKTSDIKRWPFRLLELPEGVRWLGYTDWTSLKLTDMVRYKLFTKKKTKGNYDRVRPVLEKLGKNDCRRIAGKAKFSTVVHFNGYANYITLVIGAFPCRRVIYAHNDMDAELNSETRTNMKREILCNAYRTYDAVAVVTEDLIPATTKVGTFFTKYGHEPRISVVKNVIDYQKILRMGEEEITFDPGTDMNISPERLLEIMDSDAVKLINIGRFSPEKGHMRLMQQFAKLLPKYPDSYLIILGSRGVLYNDTLAEAERLGVGERIIIIRYMSNPYALLKKCSAFVFSSFYEGFGLVLAEADILDVPCISTDIVGPKRFMERYGGRLVENSDAGVAEALRLCMSRQLSGRLTVDYAEYNKEAVEQFLHVIEEIKEDVK